MFQAMHSSGKILNAEETLRTMPSAQKEKFTCPACKEPVFIKEEHTRIDPRCPDIIIVSSHFFHSPNSTCKEAKETTTHFNRKQFVLSQLYANKVSLSSGKTILQIPQNEIAGIEQTVGNRTADVLVIFKNFDPVFGKGIVFEVMETETMESIESKMQSWATQGYSFTYFAPQEFEGNRLKSGIIIVKFPLIKLSQKVLEKIYEKIKLELLKLKNLEIVISAEQRFNQQYTCATCFYSTPNNRYPGLFCCWLKNRTTEEKHARPAEVKPDYTCPSYKPSYKKIEPKREENND
ncbi:MAG: hypothetical protein KKD77_20350 [Gammaproteobacteria bacterium]|nr:hypothetical protein [Gammaproteobacteria bacterium]